MRFVVESLEQFRLVASRIATFVMLGSIGSLIMATAFDSFLPQARLSQQADVNLARNILIALFVLGLIARVVARQSNSNSLMAVRVIEATAYAVQLLAFVPKMLLAWMAGYSDWAEIFLASIALALTTWVIRINATKAKSMASRTQGWKSGAAL